MNIVGWLSQQENLIAIRPKEPGDSRLTLTNDQARRVAWFALFVLPGAILALGVYAWRLLPDLSGAREAGELQRGGAPGR